MKYSWILESRRDEMEWVRSVCFLVEGVGGAGEILGEFGSSEGCSWLVDIDWERVLGFMVDIFVWVRIVENPSIYDVYAMLACGSSHGLGRKFVEECGFAGQGSWRELFLLSLVFALLSLPHVQVID